jgi:uncharacterized protein with FMN-binding domain
MKKYLQMSIVLSIFGLFVILKQVKGGEDIPVIGNPTKLINPIGSASPVPASAAVPPPVSGSAPTVTPTPTQMPTPKPRGQYKDGSYTGSVQDAFYGNLQVQAVISKGKITDVIFLQYPNDNRTSQYVNSQADPILKQEAILVQSANVDIVSGASASSQAFQASLADALSQAK